MFNKYYNVTLDTTTSTMYSKCKFQSVLKTEEKIINIDQVNKYYPTDIKPVNIKRISSVAYLYNKIKQQATSQIVIKR